MVNILPYRGDCLPNTQVVWVPGSFEIPLLAKAMAKSGKFDAILTIGAVVRPPRPFSDLCYLNLCYLHVVDAVCLDNVPFNTSWPISDFTAYQAKLQKATSTRICMYSTLPIFPGLCADSGHAGEGSHHPLRSSREFCDGRKFKRRHGDRCPCRFWCSNHRDHGAGLL
jgi:hypothetical protein